MSGTRWEDARTATNQPATGKEGNYCTRYGQKRTPLVEALAKNVFLFLLAVCSGSKHVTADAMPEDKTGAHAGAGLPSVEPMRRRRQPDERST